LTFASFLNFRDPNVLPIGIFVTIGLSMLPTAIGWMRTAKDARLNPDWWHPMNLPRWKWPEFVYAGIMSTGLAIAACALLFGRTKHFHVVFFITCGAAIVAIFAVRLSLRRLRRRLIGTAGLLCPRCRYSLWGLETRGKCPECGSVYSHRSVQEHWAQSMNMPEILHDPEQ
jgi:hypothetical protein